MRMRLTIPDTELDRLDTLLATVDEQMDALARE